MVLSYRFLLLFSAALYSTATIANSNSLESNQEFYNKFQEVFERINKSYVQAPDKQKMLDKALSGMVDSLDPHSNYISHEEVMEFKSSITGSFGGIGVELNYEGGLIKVITPIKGLPADRADIRSGDYIVSVDGELVKNLGFIKAVKKMRGKPNTTVKLLILRGKEETPQEIELIRESITFPSVKVGAEDQIAYISMIVFNENTINELQTELKDLMKREAEAKREIKGFILDLRNNPGGPLAQAIAVSNYFIKSGLIVTLKERNDVTKASYFANEFATKAPNLPLAVLINNGSASSSEIVAAAIQHHKRGIIIGTQSFGKGSVQTLYEIDGGKEVIKLTTGFYFTPDGESIQTKGITPDIVVKQAKVEYPQQNNETLYLEANLTNALKNPKAATDKDSRAQEAGKGSNVTESKPTGTPGTPGILGTPGAPGAPAKSPAPQIKEAKSLKGPLDMKDRYQTDYQYARALDVLKALYLLKFKP